jgi:hypothetical protein
MGICEIATIHSIKYNTMKKSANPIACGYANPIACGKITKIKNKQHGSFLLDFTDQSQIDDFIKLLKFLKAKKINHIHLQVPREMEKVCIGELTIHYPPATARQWPDYFDEE